MQDVSVTVKLKGENSFITADANSRHKLSQVKRGELNAVMSPQNVDFNRREHDSSVCKSFAFEPEINL